MPPRKHKPTLQDRLKAMVLLAQCQMGLALELSRLLPEALEKAQRRRPRRKHPRSPAR